MKGHFSISKIPRTNILLVLLILGFAIIFRKPLSEFINWLLVDTVFSKVESGLVNDLAVLSISLITSYVITKKLKSTVISFRLALVSILVYVWTLLIGYWSFAIFSFVGWLRYYDVLLLSVILSYFYLKYRKNKDIDGSLKNKSPSFSKGFVEDNPILDISNDSFNRISLAVEISNLITLTENQKSFAIGVNGPYGSGKTSFLNLLSIETKKASSENVAVINFNPWDVDPAEEIQRMFFDELIESLSSIDPNFSSILYSYSRKVIKSDSSLSGPLGRVNLLSHFLLSEPIDDRKKVDECLESWDRKVIVFIDDVDRLHSDEIKEVLRLIRNTANFRNFFYVVAYDRNYVINSLKEFNTKGYLTYLEKIFQLEIPLPKLEEVQLFSLLKENLEKVLDDEDFIELQEKIFPKYFESDYDKNLKGVFNSPRDVIRFINSVLVTYHKIKKEVLFTDYFLNELLKFKYPMFHDMIYDHSESYLVKKPYNILNKTRYILARNDEKAEWSKILERVRSENEDQFNLTSLITVEYILSELYPNVFDANRKGNESINNPQFFPLYYRYHLNSYTLSEYSFKHEIKNYNGSFFKYIDECFDKGLERELMLRIFDEKVPTNKAGFIKHLHYLFRIGSKFSSIHGTTSFYYGELIRILEDISGDTVKKVFQGNKDKYLKFVQDFFKEARQYSPFFVNQLIFEIKRKDVVEKIGTEEFFTNIQLNYFRDLITSNHQLSEDVVWLFWGLRNFELSEESDKKQIFGVFVPEAVNILLKNIEECDLTYFLKSIIERTLWEEEEYRITNMAFDEIFEKPSDLEEIVKGNEHTDKLVKDEFLSFFKKYESNKFRPVEYNFQTILKK
ncbi:KAP family P-loop NTPase fold protein [Echinicola rosea]|uniref:KAP family P-loop NTPase fold protein n=1 Tax=Echinicola rosea TaxID=1807691 RepID=UPI0010CA9351|nr:P-loop NTPase fold protein [Echinicola rosea]